uniref:SCP domain-containing protein n=1 Tax=Oryzias sinensis TaxID=183150 RepID=A0A8C7Y740_9TELE
FSKNKEFQQEFLNAHNAYRALHGAPPLTYNKELCDEAQKWADECGLERVQGTGSGNGHGW